MVVLQTGTPMYYSLIRKNAKTVEIFQYETLQLTHDESFVLQGDTLGGRPELMIINYAIIYR
jgi:hypothetical protein